VRLGTRMGDVWIWACVCEERQNKEVRGGGGGGGGDTNKKIYCLICIFF
jgi:hypothetical protein